MKTYSQQLTELIQQMLDDPTTSFSLKYGQYPTATTNDGLEIQLSAHFSSATVNSWLVLPYEQYAKYIKACQGDSQSKIRSLQQRIQDLQAQLDKLQKSDNPQN